HDDANYVPRALLEEYAAKDPVDRFRAWLQINAELTDQEQTAIEAGIRASIEQGVAEAEASPLPDPAEVMDGVYGE
ncbi:MAG: thiamine pyrophosphate-dependent enzyme, partial [Gaiellales bacterium]